MKKAYLITASVITRIIAESEEEAEEGARERLVRGLNENYPEGVEEIKEDEECPYNPETDD